jgi:hypothetical protein
MKASRPLIAASGFLICALFARAAQRAAAHLHPAS